MYASFLNFTGTEPPDFRHLPRKNCPKDRIAHLPQKLSVWILTRNGILTLEKMQVYFSQSFRGTHEE
jgi:hypothetical protein